MRLESAKSARSGRNEFGKTVKFRDYFRDEVGSERGHRLWLHLCRRSFHSPDGLYRTALEPKPHGLEKKKRRSLGFEEQKDSWR